jgi:hypothetical protein
MNSRLANTLWCLGLGASSLISGCGGAAAPDGPLIGEWRWVSSSGGWLGDTTRAASPDRRLVFNSDGSFSLDGAASNSGGVYTVRASEESSGEVVDLLEFSMKISALDDDSAFVVILAGDTLSLASPWTDARDHRFVRVAR